MKVLQDADFGLAGALRKGPWARPALVPATPWLDDEPPKAPTLRSKERNGGRELQITARGDDTFLFVVDQRVAGSWRSSIVAAASRETLFLDKDSDAVAVRAVDRTGNLGPPGWLK